MEYIFSCRKETAFIQISELRICSVLIIGMKSLVPKRFEVIAISNATDLKANNQKKVD